MRLPHADAAGVDVVVIVVSRSTTPGRYARAAGPTLAALSDGVTLLAGNECFGLYDDGAAIIERSLVQQ